MNPSDEPEKSNFDSGSFRDRTSRILYSNNRIYRVLDHSALKEWDYVNTLNFYKESVASNKIIHTISNPISSISEVIKTEDHWEALLEHDRIPFISYPYEWSFEMLKDAALLHIDLLHKALLENATIKDSSPYNIQWQGSSPIHIDTASFIELPKGSTWTGYRQFCELFLFPLMLQSYKGVAFQPWLRGSLEGISAQELNQVLTIRDALRSGVLLHVILQAKLQNQYDNSKINAQQDLKKAGFSKELIINNVKGLKKITNKLQWGQSKSTWSDYINEHNYSDKDLEEKKQFVRNICTSSKYSVIWDLGCNTGTFSRIAADNSDYVVAMDFDSLAIDHLYRSLKSENNKKILPLIGNIADPSPALGWNNKERKTLAERGTPDLILSLALIHHLVIGSNIPLNEVIQWLSELGGDLIIEFVDKNDSMTQKLLQNKEDNYSDYTQENLETLLRKHYSNIESKPLESGTRTLYFAKKH